MKRSLRLLLCVCLLNLPWCAVLAQTVRNGDATFSGTYTTDPATGRVSGEVTVVWDSGERFSGHMRDGKRQGTGRFAWANGQSYEGDWVDDRPEGHGRLRFPNGDRYEGAVHAGKPEGVGKIVYGSDGSRYEGGFHAGLPQGQGLLVDAAGNRYEGEWNAGVRNGRGVYQWASGQRYEGQWVNGEASGKASVVHPNGDRYTGQVRAGLYDGAGVLVYANGDRYEGDFRAGLPEGQGTYQWKNGDVFKGHWQAGHKSGPGRYTWADGDDWEGEYAADQPVRGRLNFTLHIDVQEAAVNALLQKTRTAAEAGSVRGVATGRALDEARLAAIPQVAVELQGCAVPDCRSTLLHAIDQGAHFEHDWQSMFTERGSTGNISYEVDRHSVSQAGTVYSWLRFLEVGNGSSRVTGIRYDCQAQALEIQLLYNCKGGGASGGCVLDRNFDKYVGKALPAAAIKGWFKTACERARGN